MVQYCHKGTEVKNIFVVYCVNTSGKTVYCVSSGAMDFSTNINDAAQYDKETAVRVAEYMQRTRTFRGCETGWIEIERSIKAKKALT